MANTTNGSLAAKAAAYLAENAGAMGRFSGIQSEIKKQADCLLKWAISNEVFLEDHYWEKFTKLEVETREHSVYVDTDRRRVIKCTKSGNFGVGHGAKPRYGLHPAATPYFYLQRLELANQLFRTDFVLEGVAVGEPEQGDDKTPLPYMVCSQIFIEAANTKSPYPTEAEIRKYMEKLGFILVQDSVYNWINSTSGIVITDTREHNFINSPEGIVPIDLVVGRIAPDEDCD